jgi:hypothetical protein
MKKSLLTFSIATFIGLAAIAQDNTTASANLQNQHPQTYSDGRTHQNLPLANYRNGYPVQEVKQSASRYAAPTQVQFANDVIIQNNASTDQRDVKIECSIPGWLYAAYTTMNAGVGGIEVDISKDHGATWQVFASGGGAGLIYTSIDITVAGADTNNLVLYVAGVLNNSGNYVAWVDLYNGATGNVIGEHFNESSGTNMMYDIELANDFLNPSIASSPYSVAVAYSDSYALNDSLIYAASLDGGATFSVRQAVLGTGAYLRKISLAYAHSANWSNGRYMIAFESRNGSAADIGNIGYIHNLSSPSTGFSAPIYLDSLSGSGMLGICRYPEIAAENDNNLNDSSGLSSFIFAERQYSSSDWDVLSFASELTINTSIASWHRIDIDNSGSVGIEGSGHYKASNQTFAVTYYDSTAQHLNVMTGSYNMLSPSFAWTPVVTGYNDLTTNLVAPKPQITIDAANGSSILVAWNSEGISAHGVALFDNENFTTGIPSVSSSFDFGKPFPNPASGNVSFNFNLKESQHVQLNVVNMLGEISLPAVDFGTLPSGQQTLNVDISSLANGVYIYQLMIGTELVTGQMTVAHQ